MLSTDRDRKLAALRATGHGAEAVASTAAVDRLLGELGLEDLGRLDKLTSRNHARLVRDGDGVERILKLTVLHVGDELAVLRAWQVPRLVDAGLVPSLLGCGRTDEGFVWALQSRLDGDTCWVNERPELTEAAVALLLRVHAEVRHDPRSADALAVLPDAPTALRADVAAALARMAGAGALPAADLARLEQAADRALAVLRARRDDATEAVLHADFACNNVVLSRSGTVGVIDPGGRRGPLGMDAARWVARSLSTDSLVDGRTRVLEAGGGRLDVAATTAALVLEGILLVSWRTYEDVIARGLDDLLEDVHALAATLPRATV